ncbi:MAG: UDP-N-acetylmuramoyl-tripeptide--D-alanyl-D-alanine ligase [Clostridia bacterium]|nr:UDP-N-acetylmuramoyl-tripeptide--D-alanyl-D-alanine ligase [Clostridia bacterium]
MSELLERIVAAVVIAVLFCAISVKCLGALQQSGYKNKTFLRWLSREGNLTFNRLSVLALCLALSTAIVSLCFSFAGVKIALVCSAVPFFLLLTMYIYADGKHALKVPLVLTGRVKRLFAAYFLVVASVSFTLVSVLKFLMIVNGSEMYALIAYVPVAVMPILLPWLLCLANALTGVFENARNKRFVKRAGEKLAQSNAVKIGVVGSYGKTSVKNILSQILSEKYAVVASQQSFNTPMGVAKTVFDEKTDGAQVLIFEMGARKKGDIAELGEMVKPDYALFTGVCPQHIQTFGSLEEVYAEKRRIFDYTKNPVLCSMALKYLAEGEEKAVFVQDTSAQEVEYGATETKFTLDIAGEKIPVSTRLLGSAAVENICLCAALAKVMGLTATEIANGIAKLQPVPHRLELREENGVYILDDGYNCNAVGASAAIEALQRFDGGKCIITPGIVECGVLEEEINRALGEKIARANLDRVILVGQTLVTAVKNGYIAAGGDESKLFIEKTLDDAKVNLSDWVQAKDAVLFLNDLPDIY